jgi:hypothetical protein
VKGPEEYRERARRLAPLLVLVVALLPRWWFVGQHPLDWYLVSNMAFYDAGARHLLSGQLSVTDTFTPVGYPALLALAHAWSSKSYEIVGYAQAILGAATCVLAHAITVRLTRSGWAALAVGLVLAFYLPLIVYAGFVLTETLFAFLVALFAWLLAGSIDRQGRSGVARAALAGLVLGGAATVRPNLLLAFPLLAAVALHLRRSAAPRPRAWLAPLWALGFSLPVLAVAVAHNSSIAGRPTGVATNGGVNFFLGHCECREVRFPPGGGVGLVSGYHNRKRWADIVESPRFAYDETYFYGETLGRIAARPALLLRALVNVGDGLVLTDLGEWPAQPYFPGWMGHEDALRAFGRGFAWLATVPALVHGAFLALRRRPSVPAEAPDRGAMRPILLALVGSMLATLYLYLGDPRMRVPFDPLIAALAVDAWRDVAQGCLRLCLRLCLRRCLQVFRRA